MPLFPELAHADLLHVLASNPLCTCLSPCSADELERLVQDAERHRAEDEEVKEKAEARSSLENFLYGCGTAAVHGAVHEAVHGVHGVGCVEIGSRTGCWLR